MNLCDQIITAFEGGSNYWIYRVDLHGQKYGDEATYDRPDWRIDIWPEGEEEEEPCILNEKAVVEGMAWLKENYPKRWAAIMIDEYDAEDSDVFLQACLFKEIVYG